MNDRILIDNNFHLEKIRASLDNIIRVLRHEKNRNDVQHRTRAEDWYVKGCQSIDELLKLGEE